MVLDAQGRVSGTIHVRDVIAKKRGGRRIPMHPDLALRQYRRTAYDEKLHPRFDGAARRPRHAQGEGDGALMSSWAIVIIVPAVVISLDRGSVEQPWTTRPARLSTGRASSRPSSPNHDIPSVRLRRLFMSSAKAAMSSLLRRQTQAKY